MIIPKGLSLDFALEHHQLHSDFAYTFNLAYTPPTKRPTCLTLPKNTQIRNVSFHTDQTKLHTN